MRNLFKVLKYAIPYWRYALLNIVFNLLSIIFSLFSFALFIPVLEILFDQTKRISQAPPPIDWGLGFFSDGALLKAHFYYEISRVIHRYGDMHALFYISLIIVILFLLKNLFRYLAQFFIAPLRNFVVQDIRNALFHKILILPLSYFTEKRKGDIISRVTSDVLEVEWSIMTSLEMIFREPITIITFLGTLFFISPQLTLFVLILLPVSGFIIGRIGKSLRKTSDRGQKKLGFILSVIEESISGLRIIKAFTAIDFTHGRFKDINHDYAKVMIGLYRKKDLASPVSEFLGITVVVMIVWFGGQLVLGGNGKLEPSVFLVYLGIFSQLIPPAKAITTALYNVQKGAASVERIEQVLNADEVIVEKKNATKINKIESKVEYRNVSFKYEDDPVLKNISFTIDKGKTIALVGPSGAGKSTLADLLPRYYDCTDGGIYIDGHDLRDIVIDDLRALMGVVTQESILFHDTVYNNICMGIENVSQEDVVAAARIANAHEFIENLPKGYQTLIGDRGTKLSGGQRQRLSIARAVLRNPQILVLDEATSALDTESERLVQDALEKLLANRTSLVIAHRLSTIQGADEIIVVEKGEIVERGTHSQLLENNGLYRKLYQLQGFGI